MTKLEIAFVTEFCPPYRTGFFERFAQRFDVEYFFCNQKESWRAYGDFECTEVSGIDVRERYRFAPALFGYLLNKRPDLIIGSPVEGFGGQASYLYARMTGTPFVLWTGEWHLPLTTLRTLTFPLIKRIYGGADSIAVYGPHIMEYLADLGVDRGKVAISWNTVANSGFKDPGAKRQIEIKRTWDVPEDAPVVLYVGRHVREKGIEYLIDGFQSAAEGMDTEPYLLVVGDGPLRESLEAKADMVDNIVFTGYVDNDDLAGYYSLADVFVLPSIQTDVFREPWGLVVNEAMSAGTPVIATGQVGAAAAGVVRDGENGYIVPERNAPIIADRLTTLLTDHELTQAMGARAKETISEYNYDRMVDGFETAIETALQRH
jgi:glycosyltransferase involved in cell wall biosynthesis